MEHHPLPFWAIAIIVVVPMSIYMFLNRRTTAPVVVCLVAAMGIMLYAYTTPMGQFAMGAGSPLALYVIHRTRPDAGPRDAAAAANPIRDWAFWLAVAVSVVYAVGSVLMARLID